MDMMYDVTTGIKYYNYVELYRLFCLFILRKCKLHETDLHHHDFYSIDFLEPSQSTNFYDNVYVNMSHTSTFVYKKQDIISVIRVIKKYQVLFIYLRV